MTGADLRGRVRSVERRRTDTPPPPPPPEEVARRPRSPWLGAFSAGTYARSGPRGMGPEVNGEVAMSRGNSPNSPANRGVGGHIKEGVKNIPKTYGALYNAKLGNARAGVAATVTSNVKTVVTGRPGAHVPPKSGAERAKIAAVGAASVTPLGPVVAVGLGIAKSVNDKKAAVAAQPKKPVGPLSPQQKQAQKKANELKGTLNEAFPGLNMKKGKLK